MFQSRRVLGQRLAGLGSSLRTVRIFAAVRWGRRFRNRKQLVAYQNKQLGRHFAFLKENSAYFGDLLTPATRLLDLPLMDKSIMMANFDRLTTTGLSRDAALEWAITQEKGRDFAGVLDGYSVGLSSGTSGHRGLFITSPAEQEEWAGTMLARALPPGNPLGHRIALFLRADNNLYERAGSKAVSFKYFDIYAPMEQNLAELAAFQPTILVAPPSVLHVIAGSLDSTVGAAADRAGGRTADRMSPQRVFSVAEVLEPRDAQYFARAFSQDIIHQIYQCTEGFLAITCAHGRIHLNEDVAIFEREYLSPGRFIPIVTDFRRTSVPIIRYRLNDVLLEDPRACPCGSVFTVISRIEGREDDVLLFERTETGQVTGSGIGNGTGLVHIFGDMVGRAMIYAHGFTHYRVVQTGPAHLDIYLDSLDPAATESVTTELDQLIDSQGCGPRTYAFHLYHHEVGAKLRRIERAFPHA